MIKTLDAIEYRVATAEDADGILSVLQEVAAEVPVSLDTPERQQRMQVVIAECCASKDSLVAVDSRGTIVGVVLAKPDVEERFFNRNGAISLRYVAVKGDHRQRGINAAMMENQMAKGVRLTTSVLHNNRSAMKDRLAKIGYTEVGSDDKETRLRWDPKGGGPGGVDQSGR